MVKDYLDFESSNQGEREGAPERRKDYSRKTQMDRGRSSGRSLHKSAGGIHRRRRKSYGI